MRDYLEPEYAEQFNAWRADPSPMNTTSMLKTIDPVISSALKTYGTQASPTLRSRAKALAIDAMGKYDPTKAKLKTHLMFQLQGLRRFAGKESQVLALPEQVALDLGHLRQAENVLRDRLGRDPSDAEVAKQTKMSLRRIGYIRKARPTYATGYFQRTQDDTEDIFSPAITQDNDAGEWQEFVYYDLQPIDQVIMEHTLGMHGKRVLSNQALAAKLRVSPGAVSQRKAKIQQMLNMREELGVL